ncbi:unnamed protein product, partial [Mesorhabditis spiculigera]
MASGLAAMSAPDTELFSFWLNVEAVPARVSLAITTLLTLSTQANAARLALPEVSYMKAIDVWMGACMMFVFGVMIEFTIVNYAQRQVMASSLESVMEKTAAGKTQKELSASNISNKARDLIGRFKGSTREHHQQLVEAEPEPDFGNQIRLRSMSHYSNFSSDVDDGCNTPQHPDAPARQFGLKLSLLHPLWPFLDAKARSSVSSNPAEGLSPPSIENRPRSYSASTNVAENNIDSPRTAANELWKDKEAEKAERLANWAAFDDSTGQLCKRSPSVWSRLVPNGVAAHNGLTANNSKSTTYGSTAENKEPNKEKKGDKWTNTIKQLQKHKRPSLLPNIQLSRLITHDRKMAGRNRAKKIDQKSRWVFPATFIIFNIMYWGYYCVVT